MKKIFSALVVAAFIGLLNSFAVAQPNPVPVSDEWARYRVWHQGFSFMFPRSPVRAVDNSQECSGRRKINYAIYKDGVVYFMSQIHKVSPPRECETKKEFSPEDFTAFLRTLKDSKKEKTPEKIKGVEAAQYRSDKQLLRVYNDPKNDRWFELSVRGKFENNEEITKFLDSFEVGKDVSGIDIGDGWANITPANAAAAVPKEMVAPIAPNKDADAPALTGGGLGSAPKSGAGVGGGIAGSASSGAKPVDKGTGVIIMLIPKPPYTEEAKREIVEGSVVLRVTFNANGTIGSVTVIRGLGFGLTEQAIAAAKRLVFVPAERQGVNYTVAKPIQYTFSLY